MNQTKSDKYPVFEALVLISSIWPVVAVGTTGLCFLLDSFFGLLTMRSVAGWIVGSGMLFVIIGWPMYMIFERVTDEIPSDLRLVTNGKSKDFSLSHNIVPVGVAAFFGIHLIWVDPFPDQRPFNGMGPYEVSWGNAFEFGCAVSVFGLLLIGGFEMWRKESMREEYGGVYREFRRSWRVVRRCIYCVPILIVAFNAAVYEIRSGSRDESNLAYRQGLDHLDDPWAKETLEHFEKAIQHNPVSPEPYLGRGMIHFWHDDLGAAKADFRTAIRLTPVNPFIVGQAGICLQRCGALDESLSAYSQAIDCISNGSEFWGESTSEQHVILLLCRCNLLVILSRFEEAINDVESMIALDPPNEYFYLIEKSRIRFLGGDHKQIDQLDDFFDRTTKRLNADPIKGSASYSAAVILQADCLTSIGKIEQAIECLKRFITTQPHAFELGRDAYVALATLQLRAGFHAEALATLQLLPIPTEVVEQRDRKRLILESLLRSSSPEDNVRQVDLALDLIRKSDIEGEFIGRLNRWTGGAEVLKRRRLTPFAGYEPFDSAFELPSTLYRPFEDLVDPPFIYNYIRSHRYEKYLKWHRDACEAAAYAELGDFAKATQIQQQLLEEYRHYLRDGTTIRQAMTDRLELYRQGKPFRVR